MRGLAAESPGSRTRGPDPGNFQAFRPDFVPRARDKPVKQRSPQIFANSVLQWAMPRFAPDVARHFESAALPSPLTLEGGTDRG